MQQLESRSRFLPEPTTNRLFTGLTAWFSNSIPQSVKDTWFLSGGELETKEEADFILSSSFSEGMIDVKNFKSRYPVVVIHGDWIVHSSKEGKILPITSYLLLPDCLKHYTKWCQVLFLLRQTTDKETVKSWFRSWYFFFMNDFPVRPFNTCIVIIMNDICRFGLWFDLMFLMPFIA